MTSEAGKGSSTSGAAVFSAEESKAIRYLTEGMSFALTEASKMYLHDVSGNILVSYFFQKPVDAKLVPTYYNIIKEPMDLSSMKKRMAGYKSSYLNGKDAKSNYPGACFVNAILKDMDLVLSNCNTFNAAPENEDIRLSATYLRNFFRWTVRLVLLILKEIGVILKCAEKFDSFVFGDDHIRLLLREVSSQEIRAYLNYDNVKSSLEEKIASTLIPIMFQRGIFPEDLRAAISKLLVLPAAVKTSFYLLSAASGSGNKVTATNTSASASASASAGTASDKVKSTARRSLPATTPKRKLDPVLDTPSYADDDDEIVFLSPTVAKSGSGKGNPKKKIRLSKSVSMATLSADSDDDEIDTWADSQSTLNTPRLPESAPAAVLSTTKRAPPSQAKKKSITERQSITPKALVDIPVWHSAAEEVIKMLLKHPFVDLNKQSTVAANFHIPVIEQNPLLTASYLEAIAVPMDFETLKNLLITGELATPNDFYLSLRLIFENAIEFNKHNADTSEYSRLLVDKSRYLLDYTRWLCLEKLPLEDPMEDNNSTVSLLTTQAREKARDEMTAVVFPTRFDEFDKSAEESRDIERLCTNRYKECKAVMTDISRTKNREEEKFMFYLAYPIDLNFVPNYLIFVREPIDLFTVHYKLDRTLPPTSKVVLDKAIADIPYVTYGEYIEDLFRVFTNAIVYNKAHLESDDTGTSAGIYNLARELKRRLEEVVLPKHLLPLADRISVCRVLQNEIEREKSKKLELEELAKRERNEILRKLIDERVAENEDFAVDIDPELKRLKTEQEIKERERAARKAIVASSNALIGSMSPAPDDLSISSPDHSPHGMHAMSGFDGDGPSVLLTSQRPLLPLVFGFGCSGRVPETFVEGVKQKRKLGDDAWCMWPIAQSGMGVVHSSLESNKPSRHTSNGSRSAAPTSATISVPASQESLSQLTAVSSHTPLDSTCKELETQGDLSSGAHTDGDSAVELATPLSIDKEIIVKNFVIHKHTRPLRSMKILRPRCAIFQDDSDSDMDVCN